MSVPVDLYAFCSRFARQCENTGSYASFHVIFSPLDCSNPFLHASPRYPRRPSQTRVPSNE
jgi:hypothetical protein